MAIGVVAAGFALLGAGRLLGAISDRKAPAARRAATGLQGLFYLAMTYVPVSFLTGNNQTGSEGQQQRTAARLFHIPAGHVLLALGGALVIVVCGFQIKGALAKDFTDGMRLSSAPPLVVAAVIAAGVSGITARALVFVPIGAGLIVAAVALQPERCPRPRRRTARSVGPPLGPRHPGGC